MTILDAICKLMLTTSCFLDKSEAQCASDRILSTYSNSIRARQRAKSPLQSGRRTSKVSGLTKAYRNLSRTMQWQCSESSRRRHVGPDLLKQLVPNLYFQAVVQK